MTKSKKPDNVQEMVTIIVNGETRQVEWWKVWRLVLKIVAGAQNKTEITINIETETT